MHHLWHDFLYTPLLNVLMYLYGGPAEENLGLAVVMLTVMLRAVPSGVPVGLCGEMAGNPVDAMALLALGFRSLSMAAPSIGPVRQMIRSVDLSVLTPYVMNLLNKGVRGMRQKLDAFARDHGVMIG